MFCGTVDILIQAFVKYDDVIILTWFIIKHWSSFQCIHWLRDLSCCTLTNQTFVLAILLLAKDM
jgi:hypothetical protein